MKRPAEWFERLIIRIRNSNKAASYVGLGLALAVGYGLVYWTGGTQNPYVHLFYFPIVYAGIFLGTNAGLITGVVAGILMGPLMPLSTNPFLMQDLLPWVLRMLIFVGSGLFSGAATESYRRHEQTIRMMFAQDQETGIPNLNSLHGRRGSLGPEEKLLVITVLLNGHETLSDRLGRDVYCHLLHKLYTRLCEGLPKGATVVYGGSGKCWLTVPSANPEADLHKIRGLLDQTMTVAEVPLHLDFSLGAAIGGHPDDCQDFSTYQPADLAARHAQKTKSPYVIYDETLAANRREIELLSTFAKALADNQMFLMFQPIVDLRTREPIGLEALTRWTHPVFGMVMPEMFIPLLEGTELIADLTDWVLRKAIERGKRMEKDGIFLPISINVTAMNLTEPGFFERMKQIVADGEADPKRIGFEMTQAAILARLDENKKGLEDWMAHGFAVALDDFGKGFSSLAELASFRVQTIKLDSAFFRRIEEDPAVRQVVRGTIDLAHRLGWKVIAVGIEDESVATLCLELGCDFAQGYHFAKPMPGNEIQSWLKNRPQ